MLKKYVVWLVFCLGCVPFAQAQIQQIRDVLPNDRVTSFELSPSLDVMDNSGSVSLSKMTLKGYYKFAPFLTAGMELPMARFESPAKSKNGLGDITLSLSMGRYNEGETWSFGAVAETVLPTATSDELGTGKVQLNPSVYGVFMPTPNWFFALGYKQQWSVAGDGGREDINVGRIRGAIAYLSDSNWWVVLDPRYYVDYEVSGQDKFQPEAEIGTMINHGTAVYLRGGGKVSGNMAGPDWTVSAGFKVLYL